jgi:FkbM family methyltransferase
MRWLKSFLVQASGSPHAQAILEWLVERAQYLMGIGAGADVQGSGEQAIFDLLPPVSAAPLCIIDAGANRGQFAQLVRHSLGTRSYRLHCFEPARHSHELLQRQLGTDPCIALNRLALGSKPGVATLYADAPGSGLASLTRRRLTHFGLELGLSETVEVTTLDAYCEAQGIGHIDWLKIDVEGHELAVLHGSQNLLTQNRIHLISFEFGGCHIDTRTYLQDFWYLFQQLGYTLHRLTPGGRLYPITTYRESLEQFRTTNFVAISRSLMG